MALPGRSSEAGLTWLMPWVCRALAPGWPEPGGENRAEGDDQQPLY
jgi:hypothetical protein